MAGKIEDLTGKRFGRWTVVSQAPKGKIPVRLWNCVCDCGNTQIIQTSTLNAGTSQSCGCLKAEKLAAREQTHGMAGTPTYKSWQAMLTRTRDENNHQYPAYGGAGKGVCDRWNVREGGSFENFLEDMGLRPEGTSLDRINGNLGYFPENCRWADNSIQGYNQKVRSTNKSGISGVWWHKETNKWQAYIRKDYKRINLGLHACFLDACAARLKAELIYYGFRRDQ